MEGQRFILVIFTLACVANVLCLSNNAECELPENLVAEIDSYEPIVKTILDAAVNGSLKGKTWQELAYFVDKFGPRISGSRALEDSIDYVLERSKKLNLDNVHGEAAKVPNWIRLDTTLSMIYLFYVEKLE